MAKNSDNLPQRDRTKAAEKMAQRRKADDKPTGWGVGNDPNRPSHPNGWQTGGRDENG